MSNTISRHHRLFWGSSYDRGLQYLLFMWPDIKKAFPDAELNICYGWDLFDIAAQGNPERQEWKKSVQQLMTQKGIFHFGRVGKEELAQVRRDCGIWAYTTDFKEINCITALDCAFDGVVPVTMDLAALQETVKYGIKIKGNIKDEKVRDEYLKALLGLMGDKKEWKRLSNKCRKFATEFTWDNISGKWINYFVEPSEQPKVSVYTPTIREGWWRVMAENLSEQTYKNIEWVIVDDHKEDRKTIADKYAKLYHLDIHYLRGDKAMAAYPRRCGLVRANNLGWQNSSGELIVFLQDFVLIPKYGIEALVDLYRHNKDALLAPTDVYYDCKPADMTNKEDWWKEKDVLTEETWRNIRTKGQGIRESENPFDWEANYGAIPRKILETLNGYWEFMDDGLGYDNTEIAYRALKLGYRIMIDDSNVAKCINLWPIIGGLSQNIASRERMLNPPRWKWLQDQTEAGKLSVVRDEELDKKISLPFEVPKSVEDKDCAKWIEEHTEEIENHWKDIIK